MMLNWYQNGLHILNQSLGTSSSWNVLTACSIILLPGNQHVLSGSIDCRVKAWDKNGNYCGILSQLSDGDWHLPQVMTGEKASTTKQVETEQELRAQRRRVARAAKYV